MNDTLTREMIVAWQAGWQAVAEVEAAERQAETMADRWQKLNSVYNLADALGILDKAREQGWNEEMAVYELWGTLRETWPTYETKPSSNSGNR